MSSGSVRLRASGLVLLLITACGGSGSGGNSSSGGSGGTGNNRNPTTVTYTFSGGIPTVFAAKVGSGDYSALTVTSKQVSFSVPVGTANFSIAYLCPPYQTGSPTTLQEFVEFESTLDGTSFKRACPIPSSAQVTEGLLTGTVDTTAFSAASSMSMAVQGLDSTGGTYINIDSDLPISGSFQATGPDGSDHALMLLYDSSTTAIAAKSFSNQTVPGAINGGNPVVFASTDAVVPRQIAYANVPTGFNAPITFVGLGYLQLANGALTQYPELPAGVLQSSDYYSIQSSAGLNSATAYSGVGATTYPSSGGAAILTFPAAWTTVDPTPSALPSLAFDYTGFAGQSNVNDFGELFWTPNGSTNEDSVYVQASQNYLGNSNSVTIPDLSGIAGFLAPPSSGTLVLWLKEIAKSNYPSTTTQANGSTVYVSTSGTYNVP